MDNNELQKQYEHLCELLSRLRKAFAIETDIPNKIKLEEQVNQAETELSEFRKKIEFIESNKIILSLKGSKNEIHCIFNNKVNIGRSLTCDFCINDDSALISNIHAGISYRSEKNQYWIEDLKSANGIHINDRKIEKPIQLSHRDKIKLSSSILLVFEHNQSNPFSPGLLIQYNSDEKEINRYIIAPKGKLYVGTNLDEVIRFPNFPDNHSFGSIEKKIDGFYFFDGDKNQQLLHHNRELNVHYFIIGISIPYIFLKESVHSTNAVSDDNERLTNIEDIEPPSGNDKPSYLFKLNICLSFIILLTELVSFNWFSPDVKQIGSRLVEQLLTDIQKEKSKFHMNYSWPPKAPFKIIFLQSSDDEIEKSFLEKLSADAKNMPISYLKPEQLDGINHLKEYLLIVKKSSELGSLKLKITYWSPEQNFAPMVELSKSEFLYWNLVIPLLSSVSLSGLIHNLAIKRHRYKLQAKYEEFQAKRTEKIFEAKNELDKARDDAQNGKLPQALIIVNRLLKSVSRSMPVYNEILDLRKIIKTQIESGGGAITLSQLVNNSSDGSSSLRSSSKLLYLRILGTPYTYQAPYGLEEISIGRQRRKKDSSVNIGNDVVIRVPGSDLRSLRISRRHLQIKRIDTEYFVIDKSDGHTKLNGKSLSGNQPYPLQSGYILSIAEVLTLEVLIRVKITGIRANNLIKIDYSNQYQDEFLIEASVGDMLTEVSYE